MLRLNNLIYTIAAAIVLLACSSEKQPSGYGYLAVNMNSEDTPEIIVKGGEEPQIPFSLNIINAKSGEKHFVQDYRSLATEPLKLSSGTYNITAFSGETANAAWDTPVYSGNTTITIKPEQVNTANITCSLANTMVTISLPEDIDKNFSDYMVTVDNGSGSPLVFSKSAGNISSTAYFAVTGKLSWTMNLKNNDGMSYSTGKITRDNVKPGQHYNLVFTMGEAEDILGGAALRISVDDVLNEKIYPLVLDFDNSGLPSITGSDFDLTKILSSPMGSLVTRKLDMTAPQGIKSLTIVTSDKNLMEAGLPMGTELVDASAAIISNINNAGIKASAVAFGSTSASIEISAFVSKLKLGRYSFTVNLIDIKNHGKTVDVNLDIISSVDAEAISAVPWGKFAIITGHWFTETRPAGLKFQYRKASDSQWIDYAQNISFDDTKKSLTADLCGLEPNTDYVFKTVSDKDKDTRTISFRTESAEDVHNLSFDNWYKSGSCWYPNASADYKVWDSANPGTSSFGAVPTTPEENDLAVSGPGKRAARLESTTCFGQFAAGNIYIGQFVKVAGLGAILDWGYKFNSRPLALKGYYKYMPKTIDKAKDPYNSLMGTTDNCQIKIFLTDWEGMFQINTSQKTFVSDDDEHIIGIGQLVSSSYNNEYVKFTIPIEYRSKTRKPNFIVITGAASRYGDYSTGGVGSVLLLDEFSLIYNPYELTEEDKVKVNYR